MNKLMIAGLAVLAVGCSSAPEGTVETGRPPCEEGAEIVVWSWESTPCDLDGSQVLTLLGMTPEECDHSGGRFELVAEGPDECARVDY